MTDPIRRDLDDLAATVDVEAAAAVFERRRRRRLARHRAVLAGSMVAVVAVVAVGLSVAGRDQGHDVTSGGPESVVAGEIGACSPTLGDEPFSFADLFELRLAWVAAEGLESEPFRAYDEYVRGFLGRAGATQQLEAVSFQRVRFRDPVVRRHGAGGEVSYGDGARVVVAPSVMVQSVRPDDTVIAVISQSTGHATGEPPDVDVIAPLAIAHPDGTVEFAGSCARQMYTEPFQRAAAAMATVDASGVYSEADILNRMIDDPAFAEEAIAASIEESDGTTDSGEAPGAEIGPGDAAPRWCAGESMGVDISIGETDPTSGSGSVSEMAARFFAVQFIDAPPVPDEIPTEGVQEARAAYVGGSGRVSLVDDDNLLASVDIFRTEHGRFMPSGYSLCTTEIEGSGAVTLADTTWMGGATGVEAVDHCEAAMARLRAAGLPTSADCGALAG